MHGISQFVHKHESREATPPLGKEGSGESWYSSISSVDSRGSMHNEGQRGIPITRGSYARHSLRSSSPSPFEFASSPRDRYPNFASYFREVMETRSSTDHRPKRDSDRYHTPAPRSHFLSPLFNDVMDDIQENENTKATEYRKCERYGDISNTKLNHMQYKHRFDNKSFAQKLADSVTTKEHERRGSDHGHSHDRRGSDHGHSHERRGSESSTGTHKHKHHYIQEMIRSFSKKMGHWREGGEGRRGSCAVPATRTETVDPEEFRSRSKSLDGEHLHRLQKRPLLEDCGATYQIFDTILKEGAHLRRAASQEAEKRRSSLGNVPPMRHRASDAFLDPHHAAILFRDSRGLPVADPFLEKVSLSDLGKSKLTSILYSE
ncbi:unnamed protein product [Plutella xylostella]|uniref:(diamondback moth) hypothetical protein n=1 Tax=Plutella xylostella TaxID=51655 RepID=A0A8S4GEU4_PLUXY|nr:unnamed protein product [Plutella xylostella]